MINQDMEDLQKLIDRIEYLEAENARLISGDFTDEEIHGFCHKLPEKVNRCEFEKGCKEYRDKLYGVKE